MFTETTIGILTERDLAREAKLDARKSQMETAALRGMRTRITAAHQNTGTQEPELLLLGLYNQLPPVETCHTRYFHLLRLIHLLSHLLVLFHYDATIDESSHQNQKYSHTHLELLVVIVYYY
jgi:hypothetical protein